MDRYDARTPPWEYPDSADHDDRPASARGPYRGRAAPGGPNWDGDRYSQARGRSVRGGPGYPARGVGREPERYFGDSNAGRGRDGRSASFWPSELGYPPSPGYAPYGGRVPVAHDGDERGFFERAGDEVLSWFGDRDARRRREVDHRGRGPKNYTRPDERIREDANDRLTEDVWIDASEVEITAADGEVTLNGTVEDRRAKRRAEDCVEAVAGVKHVQNNLRYHSGVESPRIAD